MSGARRALSARSCAVGRGERGIRAVIAVFLAAFALNNLDNLWCAIPAGICATFLAIGAITGAPGIVTVDEPVETLRAMRVTAS